MTHLTTVNEAAGAASFLFVSCF